MSWQVTWQDGVTWLIVAGAAAFLVDRFVFAGRRKKQAASTKPDVPVKALVRKQWGQIADASGKPVVRVFTTALEYTPSATVLDALVAVVVAPVGVLVAVGLVLSVARSRRNR
mgnify:CR=1 FL=1